MRFFVTGAAGFIGSAVSEKLLNENNTVIAIDNINDYYDVHLKNARLERLSGYDNFHFSKVDLLEKNKIDDLFQKYKPEKIIHLAAQAGVRYSIENPQAYVDSNLVGFFNILELAKRYSVEHFVFASSSSVYGNTNKLPFSTMDNCDHPVSLYAATKKSNELMAHTYSHLYQLQVTGLRYFTVYGPWGRPDMAPIKFAKLISAGEPITIYNHGKHKRDFTYIDDIVEGTVSVAQQIASNENTPYNIYNIGNGNPKQLMHFIELLENALGKTAIKNFVDKQPGDVDDTWADVSELEKAIAYKPKVSLEEGIPKFIDWFCTYYPKA